MRATLPLVAAALVAAALVAAALVAASVAASALPGGAADGLALSARPTALALASEAASTVDVVFEGQDGRGGAFDLFASGDDVRVAFPEWPRREGVVVLPGAPFSARWTPTVDAAGAADGAHNVTFRMIERPGPPAPRTFEVVVRVVVGEAAAAAEPAPAGPPPVPARVGSDDATVRLPFPGPLAGALVAVAALGALATPAIAARAGLVPGWRRARSAIAAMVGGLPLYWRVRRDRLLEHPVRADMMARVRAEPGIQRARLQAALGLSDGQMDHHLARLVAAGYLTRVERHGARVFYPAGGPVPSHSRAREHVLALLADGRPRAARGVAGALGLTRQLARYYLEALAAEGLVRVERRGLARTYVAAAPDARDSDEREGRP